MTAKRTCLVLLFVLTNADAAATLHWVYVVGVTEANPLVAEALALAGPGWLVFRQAMISLVCFAMWQLWEPLRDRTASLVVFSAIAAYSALAVWHLWGVICIR